MSAATSIHASWMTIVTTRPYMHMQYLHAVARVLWVDGGDTYLLSPSKLLELKAAFGSALVPVIGTQMMLQCLASLPCLNRLAAQLARVHTASQTTGPPEDCSCRQQR